MESVAHYLILKKLGSGGMGVVYLAEDTRLGRRVALKLLPAESGKDPECLLRFQQEARVISALNHPNILTIYEIGLAGAGRFIATEFIEGETLRQLLDRTRPDLQQILGIAIQVAAALVAAHDARVVHRDVKPENIMLRADGYVKVLDFGLAKLAPPPAASRFDAQTTAGTLTNPGMVMGTVRYMSPEQARGLDVDHRTDIFAFGVVMYEMACGYLPFQGGTNSDTIVAILTKDPPPLNFYAQNAHPELQRILTKCLAKDRENRYATARECLADLKNLQQFLNTGASLRQTDGSGATGATLPRKDSALSAGTAPAAGTMPASFSTSGPVPRRKTKMAVDSIAVLPLDNATSDSSADYLSEGITETIINSLSRLPRLRVMARSTVFRYKERKADPLAIGTELGVRSVLSGRLILHGDNLIVRVELVDVADGSQLWGDQYKRKFSDIFEIEEEISREILESLRGKLSSEEKRKLAKRSTESAQAYQLYLQGRFHWNKRTGEGLQKGIEFFQRAITLDPSYALAYVGLAEACVLQAWFAFGLRPPREAMPIARSSALRALELDGALFEARVSLALVRLLYDWDWDGAESEFRVAIDSKPGYATAHHWFPICLTAAGRFDEALHEIDTALEIEPLSLIINATRGWILYYAGRYEEAVRQFHKTLELDSRFPAAHWLMGLALEAEGKFAESIAELEEACREDKTPAMMSALGHVLAVSGRASSALRMIEELDQLSLVRYVPPESQGVVYAGLGDADRAFQWFNRAVEEHSNYLIYIAVDPRMASLRSHPSFTRLLSKTNSKLQF